MVKTNGNNFGIDLNLTDHGSVVYNNPEMQKIQHQVVAAHLTNAASRSETYADACLGGATEAYLNAKLSGHKQAGNAAAIGCVSSVGRQAANDSCVILSIPRIKYDNPALEDFIQSSKIFTENGSQILGAILNSPSDYQTES